jgi:hypothetical protein
VPRPLSHAEVLKRIQATTKHERPKLTRRDIGAFVADFPPDFYDLPCINSNCKLCKAVTPHQDLRRAVNMMLLAGHPHPDIVALLAEHDIEATPQNLSGHYRKHVLPYVLDLMRLKAQTTVFVQAARDLGQEDSLAQTLVKSLLLKLQPCVEALDPSQLALVEPDKQIALLLQAAKSLSSVQNAEAGTKLRTLELALKRAKLSDAEREAMKRAAGELRAILKAHPQVWQAVEPILAPLASLPGLPEVPGG